MITEEYKKDGRWTGETIDKGVILDAIDEVKYDAQMLYTKKDVIELLEKLIKE